MMSNNPRRAFGVIQKWEICWKLFWSWSLNFEFLRLGQLLENAHKTDKRISDTDFFYVEDYDLLDAITTR